MTTALVIDDNRLPADGLCQLLSLLDIDACPAYGSRAGILFMAEEVPDIVFLDINMPGVGGFEVLGFMRREPRLLNIPVVVVTADDSMETLDKAFELGAVDLITKPASLEALENVLKQVNLV